MSQELSPSLIHALTEAGRLHSDRPAVSDGERTLCYGELYMQATKLAGAIHPLVATLPGDGQPHRIGICLGQSCESVLVVLAVLLSGNIYVPLEVHLPGSRLQEIIADAGISLVITNDQWEPKATGLIENRNILLLNTDVVEKAQDPLELPALPAEHPAYILYTSGTTGKPKGVIQTHRTLLFFATVFADLVRVTAADKIALTTSLSHTVSVIDIFSHLLRGACIVVYDMKAIRDLGQLPAQFAAHGITIFHSIPHLFRSLFGGSFSAAVPDSIRLVILGGEDIRMKDFELYRRVCRDNAVMVNLYGSSELIIACAQLLNKRSVLDRERIPIGFPVKGVSYEVRGETGARCGVLGTGQLVFKSDYLSPGYWNQASSTIVPDTAQPGILVYHSGDLGRILPTGNLEYLGRADAQIKINGNRIELQEIEVVLEKLDDIRKCIVKTFRRENEELFIACFYQAAGTDPGTVALRDHLRAYLPEFMIPERLIRVDQFPLTTTGKIDRKALDLTAYGQQAVKTDQGPATPRQQQVAAAWQEVLGHDQFSRTDKFFEAGGNSLRLIELYTLLQTWFPGQLSVQAIFEHQTVQAMAALLEERLQDEPVMAELVEDIEF